MKTFQMKSKQKYRGMVHILIHTECIVEEHATYSSKLKDF